MTGGALLAAVRRWAREVGPQRRHLKDDLLAGLPGAISSVPDGMASGVLAGVNPVHGLYASFAGPIAGGLGTNTRLMVVTTTSAAALAAGSAVSGFDPADRSGAILVLTLLAGVLMVAAGLLRLGRYTRFVSHSVMLGFLSGVGVSLVLGQLPDLTGTPSHGGTSVAKASHVLTNPTSIDVASLVVGGLAILILVGLARTRLGVIGALVALLAPTLVVIVAGLDSVARVEDGGAIPAGLPWPELPDLGLLSVNLIVGALAVAAIVLVQGAGVAESQPNHDGTADADHDFIGQGAGNLAAGMLGGMPVGGSVGQTALNATAGARTRWAGIWSGLWMMAILLVFSSAVGKIAMPTLAAVLIVAGVGSLRPAEVRTVLRTGPNSQIALLTTFVATLFLPVAVAVGLGVVLSLLLQLNQEAIDLAVVELVPGDDGELVERPAPTTLAPHSVTVLDVYGSLFYAGSRTLQARLPATAGAEGSVVVIRLRGRTTLGATFFKVISGYAAALAAVDGELYLSGLDDELSRRLRSASKTPLTGSARLYAARPVLGASTASAVADAETWVVQHDPRHGSRGG